MPVTLFGGIIEGATMFVHSNFEQPKPPVEPFQENRVVGLAVLLFCFVLCLLFSLGVDATVIVPLNATKAITQTWQAQHPQTTTPTAAATARRLAPTAIPDNPYQQVDAHPNDLEH